jgi:hypothetical protein
LVYVQGSFSSVASPPHGPHFPVLFQRITTTRFEMSLFDSPALREANSSLNFFLQLQPSQLKPAFPRSFGIL